MPIKTDPFESIEKLGKKAGQTITVIGGDIAEQFGLKEIPKEEKQEIKKQDRSNIAEINRQIAEIREKNKNKLVEVKQEKKQTEQKKFFEKKKKEFSVMDIIKSNKGTKEGVNRVGG